MRALAVMSVLWVATMCGVVARDAQSVSRPAINVLPREAVVRDDSGGDDIGAPARLSETGLFVDGTFGEVAAQNRPFSPQYPLWTDGASKRRWVYLPPGATIDATDPNGWELPVGTKFWKEFAFNGRAVETRMIWRVSDSRWVFASYVWNDEGSDAVRAPDAGLRGAAPLSPGKRHDIPSVSDCTACHGTERPGPLGFSALQLSPDRDPDAIHGEKADVGMVMLDVLQRERLLVGAPSNAYATAPRIRTVDPATRSALGYLLANCGHCHNGRGEIAALGPTLKIEELLKDGDVVARRLDRQATRWQVPGVEQGASVVVDPDSHEKSALLVRMRSRSPSSQMPPLGTVLRDAVAVGRISAWVSRDRAPQSHR